MKEKNVAGFLAFFGGFLGLHRFYLGQIPLGIVYLVFQPLGFFLGFIDALVFWSMDQEKFDYKYNPRDYRSIYGRYNPQQRFYDEHTRRRDIKRSKYRDRGFEEDQPRDYRSKAMDIQDSRRRNQERMTDKNRSSYSKRHHPYKKDHQNQLNKQKAVPHIEQGKSMFRDYDYEGAILAFEQALKYDAYNYPLYFNLACAYSLIEDEEKALKNLDKAVELGFRDFEKIESHDAFSYLRVKPAFESFKANNYRLPQTKFQEKNEVDDIKKDDLLTQLNYLKDLRERGLLSQSEFEKEKSKLSS
jgi:TM2 domain-containing membrane protein YozV